MRRSLFAMGILAFQPLLGFSADPPPADKKEEKKAKTEKPRIAVFHLNSPVTELPTDETFSFSTSARITLKDLVRRMKTAADDPAVKAVVILPAGLVSSRVASIGIAARRRLSLWQKWNRMKPGWR